MVWGIRHRAAGLAQRDNENGVSAAASGGRNGGMERVEEKGVLGGAGTLQDLAEVVTAEALG